MQEKGADRGLVVLGIHEKRDPGGLAAFVKEQGLSHRVLVDDGSAFRDYGVTGIPFTVLLDRQGRIAWIFRGYAEGLAGEIEAEVAKVLGGS